jgi:hypothetical protein
VGREGRFERVAGGRSRLGARSPNGRRSWRLRRWPGVAGLAGVEVADHQEVRDTGAKADEKLQAALFSNHPGLGSMGTGSGGVR